LWFKSLIVRRVRPRVIKPSGSDMLGFWCCAKVKDPSKVHFVSTTDEDPLSLSAPPTATSDDDATKKSQPASSEDCNQNHAELVNSDQQVPIAATRDEQEGPQSSYVQDTSYAPGDDPPHSDRSLDDEEKELEKVRLQQRVNDFAKRALKGCPCILFKGSPAERYESQYCIDKNLDHLIVLSPTDMNAAEINCPIGDIQDIYSIVEDGPACFPPEVIAGVATQSEMERLLMVVYHNAGKKNLVRFCIVEESCDSRDAFLECLRILCIYAQSTGKQ